MVENKVVRAAEVIGAACLATDLAMGFPFEHGLEGTVVSSRLARLLDVDVETESEVFYLSLLMYIGCTTDAEPNAKLFGGNRVENLTSNQFGEKSQLIRGVIRNLPDPGVGPIVKAYQVATRLPRASTFQKNHFASMCEVAVTLSDRLGAPTRVSQLFNVLTERWDGKGVLDRAAGDEVPMALRIVHVARDGLFQSLIGGPEYAANVIRDRAGGAFDPSVAATFAENAAELLDHDGPTSWWDTFLGLEPKPHRTLDDPAFERALAALGDFADMVSPRMSGHSPGVANLAAAGAGLAGLNADSIRALRRAALVHDVGRSAIDPRVWQKPTHLSADEWEKVRLHPYHTGRVLAPSQSLRELSELACCHHERIDGSGYYRGLPSAALAPAARFLAAADAFHAMGEPRHHRPALSLDESADVLAAEVKGGRMDADAVEAVITAAGLDRPRVTDPANLTTRETEVIGLLARGLQTKQIAARLEISPKTADRHIQNSYRKMGVSTRAAATLYATEHGLVPWGEFPIN